MTKLNQKLKKEILTLHYYRQPSISGIVFTSTGIRHLIMHHTKCIPIFFSSIQVEFLGPILQNPLYSLYLLYSPERGEDDSNIKNSYLPRLGIFDIKEKSYPASSIY